MLKGSKWVLAPSAPKNRIYAFLRVQWILDLVNFLGVDKNWLIRENWLFREAIRLFSQIGQPRKMDYFKKIDYLVIV